MKHLSIAAICLGLIVGLAACETDTAPVDEMAADTTGEANGWIALSSADAWRGYRSDSLPGKWEITDGTFHFNAAAEGSGGDIITREQFDNFELTMEWRIDSCGNSGIFYRVQESDQYQNTYHTGPEYQVLDNACHPDAENAPDRWAGANYALHAPEYAQRGFEQKQQGGQLDPAVNLARPPGEWNETRIVVDGAHVEHWLNGQKVVEYELWSDDWKQRVAASKFTEWPDYGLARSGHVALQDHGDDVWFRNIRIRPL